MLTQYKNISDIQSATGSLAASRFLEEHSSQFNVSIKPNADITQPDASDIIEMHIYGDQTWITGNHSVQPVYQIPRYYDRTTGREIKFNGVPVGINLYKEFENLRLTSGKFRVVLNFFKNLIGSYEKPYLKIVEISADRTEILLKPTQATNAEFRDQLIDFADRPRQTSARGGQYYDFYILNFSRNQTSLIVNTVVIEDSIYVKLYEPLPKNILENFKCWIAQEQKEPFVDNVYINAKEIEIEQNVLAGPNWYANYSYNTSTTTGLKNWTDLLGSSINTSQQIVDSYFSGSLSGVKLNIDYSDFNNFVFYSSATERLENFRYKLSLVEYYNSQSAAIALISGSIATTNAADYTLQKTNLIGGFDDFEKYLYYQSSSMIFTYPVPHESPNVARITGSYLTPAPKSNSTYPFALYPLTSSQFTTWFDSMYSYATAYDTFNLNSLIRTVPEYIRYDENNVAMETFVNMLGHHYDILYTYINHMSQINKREENPKLGMPNELLYSVAKQFGWNLTDGNQYQDLWQYVLGTSEAGIPLTGSNSVGDPSVSGQNMTYAVWRRIVNNLPLLLKSKGTKRSIQALLSCYGIPQSLITIKEYGGPRIERAPVYEKLNFDYALDLITNTAGTVTTNYSGSIDSIELRFRTDDVITNPTMPSTMNLFKVGNNNVTLDYTSGTRGTIQINGTGSNSIELFDGGWLNLILKTNGGNLNILAKRAKYGKIVAAASASAVASFPGSGSIIFGGTSTGASRLVGQLQEFRIWNYPVPVSSFNNHVKAPGAYDSLDAYNELVYHLPLNQNINHAATASLSGIQPKASTISSSFSGWTNNIPYDSIEETYYYDAVSIGAGTYDDNKVRIENNVLVGTLDIKTRAERSQYDVAPIDSKKLGVYFSPQTMIDEDIIAQLGFIDLDNYIGDPGDINSDSYDSLTQFAESYWKKYQQATDINSYIKMFTLFDLSFFKQLEQLLPARVDELLGVLIQPNILERNKASILPEIRIHDNSYYAEITNSQPTASGDYINYLGSIDGKILTISAQDDDQWQAYLTASTADKYDGTPYSYTYLIQSGSTYITASSPYWQSEAILPVILDAVTSELSFVTSGSYFAISSSFSGSYYGTGSYGSGSYGVVSNFRNLTGSFAQVQDFLPAGRDNQKYSGAKLTSPAFNVNSTETVDGKPVVEWRATNPNQLVYQTNSDQGSFVLV